MTFKDIIAWQKAYEFVLIVYRLTPKFPSSETYGLASQFQRAAVSIAANIAEGYKKLSKADKLRFMNIAQVVWKSVGFTLCYPKTLVILLWKSMSN